MRFVLLITLAVAVTMATAIAQQPSDTHTSQPIFKQHRIGESAKDFFTIAKMSGVDGLVTGIYCRAVVEIHDVRIAAEEAKSAGRKDKSESASIADLEGCKQVMGALAGKDVEVGARFATELGSGKVEFVSGKLASMTLILDAHFDEVVSDMSGKLNAQPSLQKSIDNAYGIRVHEAMWAVPNIIALVSEVKSPTSVDLGAIVSVEDRAARQHLQKLRDSSPLNTLN